MDKEAFLKRLEVFKQWISDRERTEAMWWLSLEEFAHVQYRKTHNPQSHTVKETT